MAFWALTPVPPSASIPPSLSRRSAMYLRATKTHTKGGKTAKSFRLSRSGTDRRQGPPGDPVEPGRGLSGSGGAVADVALVTEVLLAGQRPMLPVPPDIQVAAEDLVRRLRATGMGRRSRRGGAGSERWRRWTWIRWSMTTLARQEGSASAWQGWRSWAFGTCCTRRGCGAGMRGSPPRWWWRRCCIRAASGRRCGGCGRTARRWSFWIWIVARRCRSRSSTGRGMCCGGCGGRCRRGCSAGSGSCWSCRTRSFSTI